MSEVAAGSIVRVRSRQYLVEEVVPPPAGGEHTRVRLACLDDDAQGQRLDVLWEAELDAQTLDAHSWLKSAERGFDAPRRFAAWLHTQRWNCVTATDPRLLQSPWRAGIEVMPYQLEPLRKALQLPRVNLFIADDVGLGQLHSARAAAKRGAGRVARRCRSGSGNRRPVRKVAGKRPTDPTSALSS